MKYIYNLAFKMAISATVSLYIGNILNLNFTTVAAVIAILSIQDTRLKAIVVGKNRIIAGIIGIGLSIFIYGIFGQTPLTFAAFLLIFIPMTSRLKIEEGMVASVVLSTHLLVADTITLGWVVNEVLLLIIGIGIASIANIFMPSLVDKFNEDKDLIEENYRVMLSKMAKTLITQTVDLDEEKIMHKIEQHLQSSRDTAYKIVNNNFFSSTSYYTDYINMRINQFDALKRMRKNFDRFNMPVQQMVLMSEFTRNVSENIIETNDCEDLLKRLNALKEEFKKMDLPKTRDEFENRAQLLQFLNDLEEFLTIKRNFAVTILRTSNV